VATLDTRTAPDHQHTAAWLRRARLRGGPLGELALALPPTLTMIATLFFVEVLTSQRILFASLASSAFLIYREPTHGMNSVRVMASAHVAATALGIGCAFLLGAGYVAAALAMALTIVVLVLGGLVHPPAVSTALGFAFYARQDEAVGVFLLALLMVAVLVVLERVAIWTLARVQPAIAPDRPDDTPVPRAQVVS
jgi:CBS-domain-containing membrane protein